MATQSSCRISADGYPNEEKAGGLDVCVLRNFVAPMYCLFIIVDNNKSGRRIFQTSTHPVSDYSFQKTNSLCTRNQFCFKIVGNSQSISQRRRIQKCFATRKIIVSKLTNSYTNTHPMTPTTECRITNSNNCSYHRTMHQKTMN